jgi:VWFA-related protein
MTSRRALAALAALLAAGAAGAAPPKAPAGARFGETATVVSIEVPVTVVRGDEPVRGLTAADFELYEGRKRQRITGFEAVDLAAPAAPAAAATAAPAAPGAAAAPAGVPIAGRRHFLLLFDLSFSEPAALLKARAAATDLLRKGMHPSDLVAVASYRTSEGPRLLLGFTPDRRQAAYAIDTLGAPQLVDRRPDPLGLIFLAERSDTGGASSTTRDNDGGYRPLPLDHFQDLARLDARADRQARGNDIAAMSRSLADLAKVMGGIDGKKYVVYFSQGFDSEFVLGATDAETARRNHEAAEDGELQRIDSEQRFGDTRISTGVHRMLEEFRRANCTIESVDIGGLKAGGDQDVHHAGGKESLFLLARDTGGDLFENTNDLGGAMSRMLERTSVTYILSFEPGELGEAGSYHELRVKLADERAHRGARVVYRPGYYAPRPFLARSPLERRLASAGLVVSEAAGGHIATAILATPLPSPGGSGAPAYVPVVVEVDGPALLAGATDAAQAEIYVYAFDAQGTIHGHFGQVLALDLGKVRRTLERGGVKLYGHLDLAPGRYVLRALVRNGITGESGLRVLALGVPAFDRGEPALLPPLVADAAGRWLNLRAAGDDKGRPVPYPFMAGGQPFVPAARPVVAAGSETPLVLMGTGLGAGELAVAGRVLGADGRPREGAAVALRGRAVAAGAGGPAGVERLLATFRAGSLPAGDYTLVVTLTDRATRRELSSSLPFVVAASGPAEGRR